MITQQTHLGEQLVLNGWKIIEKREENLDWWADEIWTLESTWSPVGITVFLTFLVDPQWDGVRRKGEQVWAIGATMQRPKIHSPDALICIRPKWESRLPQFLEELNYLRVKAKTSLNGSFQT